MRVRPVLFLLIAFHFACTERYSPGSPSDIDTVHRAFLLDSGLDPNEVYLLDSLTISSSAPWRSRDLVSNFRSQGLDVNRSFLAALDSVMVQPPHKLHPTSWDHPLFTRSATPGPTPYKLKLSRPVFEADRATALLYVELDCPGACGSGLLILLRKNASGWEVSERANWWES